MAKTQTTNPSQNTLLDAKLTKTDESLEDPALTLQKKLPKGAWVGGLDEVGRGPLAGPVVAACVVLNPTKTITGLSDSKKLTEKKREFLFNEIKEKALAYGIATVEANIIDEMNILRASLHAMRLAFEECNAQLIKKGHTSMQGAVVDGNQKVALPEDITQITIIKGDNKSKPIMAASILAKVARDRRMKDEDKHYPMYGFAKHKGYPTKFHREALKEYGACVLHRRSYAPVRNVISQGNLLKI